MSHVIVRRVLVLSALLTFAVCAQAQPFPVNTTDLGKPYPNTADVSASPYFHVYQFQLNAVRYIQINDLQNQVRAAFALANGVVLPLPVGADSQRISMSSQTVASGTTQAIYRDAQVRVLMVPQSDGIGWQVVPASSMQVPALKPATCTKTDCGNDARSQVSAFTCTKTDCGNDAPRALQQPQNGYRSN